MNQDELCSRLLGFENIFFDLDNTVYNQRDYDRPAFTEVFAEFCGDIAPDRFVEKLLAYKRVKGGEYRYLFNDAFDWLDQPDADVRTAVKKYRAHDCRELSRQRSLAGVLSKLQNSGKKLFLVTNGWQEIQNRKLDALEIRDFFAEIYICQPGNPDFPGKPDATVFKKSGVAPETSVMVGDSHDTDEGFARNAGIEFISYVFPADDRRVR